MPPNRFSNAPVDIIGPDQVLDLADAADAVEVIAARQRRAGGAGGGALGGGGGGRLSCGQWAVSDVTAATQNYLQARANLAIKDTVLM